MMNSSKQPMNTWKDGITAVQGIYCGQPYRGIITDSRTAVNVMVWTVTLSEPITVFGHERTVIEIRDNSKDDTIQVSA